jgi:hypothetical protein
MGVTGRSAGFRDRSAGSGQSPAGSGESSAGAGHPSAGSGETLADAGRTSAETGQPFADSGQSPAGPGRPPTDAGQSMAGTGRSIPDAGRSTAGSGRSAQESGESMPDRRLSAIMDGRIGTSVLRSVRWSSPPRRCTLVRCFPFLSLILLLATVPAGAEVPPFGVRPPTEEGVYLVMRDRSTVKLPRLTGKPCDVQTSGSGVEKLFYVPVSALSQIPIVTSGEVQGGYFVSRTEKIADIRNLVFLDSYLEGRKILPGASKDGCLEGEIKDPSGYIAVSPGRSDFDKVLRVGSVNDSAMSLEILSRLPFEVDRTRPAAFGTLILSDKSSYYPFIPQSRLLGFLDHVLDQHRQGDLDPRAVELATLLEKHLQEAGESAKPVAWVMVASVYRVAGLVDKARTIYSSKIEPKVWASADGKLVQELGERYQELVQAFGVSR